MVHTELSTTEKTKFVLLSTEQNIFKIVACSHSVVFYSKPGSLVVSYSLTDNDCLHAAENYPNFRL